MFPSLHRLILYDKRYIFSWIQLARRPLVVIRLFFFLFFFFLLVIVGSRFLLQTNMKVSDSVDEILCPVTAWCFVL